VRRHYAQQAKVANSHQEHLVTELKSLERVAMTNQVALKVVSTASSPSELLVTLDFSVHKTFLVVKAKRK
jgi:hypothetical protein